MKSRKKIGRAKKLSHPISEANLRKAVDIFLKNKKNKLLNDLDERCDLNYSFTNTVLHKCIMPKKGAGVKRANNRNSDDDELIKVKKEPGVLDDLKKIRTEKRRFATILYDTNNYTLSSDETVFHPEKPRGSNSKVSEIRTRAMPKNLATIEKELTESTDSPRYGIIDLILKEKIDGYDGHTLAFYGYGKQLWFIDVTNTEEPYDNALFKKLKDGVALKDYKPEGYIFYYNRIGKSIKLDSISLQPKDTTNSMSQSPLTTTSISSIDKENTSTLTSPVIPPIKNSTQDALATSSSSTSESMIQPNITALTEIQKKYKRRPEHELKLNREFLCTKDCDKRFTTKGNLNKHIRMYHADEHGNASYNKSKNLKREFLCPYSDCGKQYVQAVTLKRHIRTIHTGENCLSCSWCSKIFPDPSGYNRHIKTHTDEKPFQCEVKQCLKSFTRKDNLKLHYDRMHNNTLGVMPLPNNTHEPAYSLSSSVVNITPPNMNFTAQNDALGFSKNNNTDQWVNSLEQRSCSSSSSSILASSSTSNNLVNLSIPLPQSEPNLPFDKNQIILNVFQEIINGFKNRGINAPILHDMSVDTNMLSVPDTMPLMSSSALITKSLSSYPPTMDNPAELVSHIQNPITNNKRKREEERDQLLSFTVPDDNNNHSKEFTLNPHIKKAMT